MKVFISYPPIKNIKGTPLLGQNRQYQVFHNPTYIYPMVPASAATLLKEKGHQVIWNDCIAQRWSYQKFIDFVKQEKPDLIAIETKTPVVKQHWEVIKDLKQLTTVLMGDHVTALPEESMQNSPVDFVITGGDYDFSLLSIVEHLARAKPLTCGIYYRQDKAIENSGKFELNGNLDDLPFIDRELTKWKLYGEKIYKRAPFTYTMAGRDCPWARCSFCSWTTLYPNFRVRSPESLLEEIGLLIEKYKIREIFDDTGTFPRGEWLNRFCEGMINRGYNKKVLFSCNFRFDYLEKNSLKLMKQAGFRLFKLGLESANEKTLQKLNKATTVEQIKQGCRLVKQAGLEVHLTIMLGYPWETKADALRTVELARDLMKKGLCDMLQATVVIPYPGTPLYAEAVENSWFRFGPTEYSRYDMQEPVLKTKDISAKDVMSLADRTYSSFLQPRFLFRYLSNIRTVSDIQYILRGSKAVMGHLLDFRRKVNGKR
ncbi:MAG: B12-binding domain-containing radical SAM protein [Omnitrophica bacterium]|nr:B12-binding domain-containing radical SAM protein [Candidatus Omnitrophota bacterium]